MKIIILSAGKGERLLPLTRDTPKSLIDIGNGNTLMEEQIKRINKSGVIDEIVLVIGYLAEQFEEKIQKYLNEGIMVKTIYNPFFDFSNNLVSLWLSKFEMNTDFIITNGDNIFSHDVFEDFVKKNGDGIHLSVSVKENYDMDDMKVKVQKKLINKVSKLISPSECDAESPGLALIKGEKSRDLFKNNLDKIIKNENVINDYWLEIFNFMSKKGIPIYPWEFDGNSKWQEIDIHLDIQLAKSLLEKKYFKLD